MKKIFKALSVCALGVMLVSCGEKDKLSGEYSFNLTGSSFKTTSDISIKKDGDNYVVNANYKCSPDKLNESFEFEFVGKVSEKKDASQKKGILYSKAVTDYTLKNDKGETLIVSFAEDTDLNKLKDEYSQGLLDLDIMNKSTSDTVSILNLDVSYEPINGIKIK